MWLIFIHGLLWVQNHASQLSQNAPAWIPLDCIGFLHMATYIAF